MVMLITQASIAHKRIIAEIGPILRKKSPRKRFLITMRYIGKQSNYGGREAQGGFVTNGLKDGVGPA
jgi:hypothetical protein